MQTDSTVHAQPCPLEFQDVGWRWNCSLSRDALLRDRKLSEWAFSLATHYNFKRDYELPCGARLWARPYVLTWPDIRRDSIAPFSEFNAAVSTLLERGWLAPHYSPVFSS